jgi:uncharacterized protein YjbJ (UPF0337 family)
VEICYLIAFPDSDNGKSPPPEQFKGLIKEKWGQLTDDDVDRVSGSAERLVGVIQERYGYAKQKAEDEVDAFLTRYGATTP